MPQEIGHGLLDELVGDGLLGLVLIGGLGREGGGNQHQAVLDVLKADFALVLQVPAILLEIGVHLGNEGGTHRLFRCAPMLEPAGIVVVFQ